MHARAGLLLIATTSVFCAAAQAQTSGDAPAKAALFDTVFASPPSAGFGPAAWSAPGSAAPPMLMDQTLVASAAPAPTVFKMSVGGLDFDVSPHARVDGASGDGGAEAGATFSLGRRPQADALSRLGLRADSDAGPHGPGRWRLFVAASGHEIDWAMARSLPGGL